MVSELPTPRAPSMDDSLFEKFMEPWLQWEEQKQEPQLAHRNSLLCAHCVLLCHPQQDHFQVESGGMGM